MKKAKLFCVILFVSCFTNVLFSQTYTIEGHAYLQLTSSFDGIMVVLNRTVPTILIDTTYTDSSGYYTKVIEEGIYTITFKKNNFYSKILKDVKIFNNQTIQTVTLQSAGLSGNLSGILTKGDYIVGDSVTVRKQDTLIIEPGTRFFFKKGLNFPVYGTILARGTQTDSIFFTRYLDSLDNPDSVLWKGFIFYGKGIGYLDTNYSKFDYCHISYCSQAINCYTACPALYNLLISDCIGGPILTYSFCYAKMKNIRLTNNSTMDTCFTPPVGSPIIYICNAFSNVENVEIDHNKSKYQTAVSFYGIGGFLNNFFIHDNPGIAIDATWLSNDAKTQLNNFTIVNNGLGIKGTFENSLIFNNALIANNGGITTSGYKLNSSNIYNNGNVLYDSTSWLGVNVKVNKKGDSCDAYGNIQLDPQFVDHSNGNYKLKPTSPCIDAGVNDSVVVKKDFAGNSRIWDGDNNGTAIVDMGAFEYGAPIDTTKDMIKENFESGTLVWKVSTQGDASNNWKIVNDPSNAHSGENYLRITGNSNAQSSTMTTQTVTIPDTGVIHLTFWLNSIYSTKKVTTNNDRPLSSIVKEFSVLVNRGGDISSPVQLIKISDVKDVWTKYNVDLSTYCSEDLSLSFVGNITGVTTGTQYIMLDDILVSLEEEPTSVNEPPIIFKVNNILIYPNPANTFININLSSEYQTSQIKIFSIEGIFVYQEPSEGLQQSEGYKIDVSGFAPGVYYVKVGDRVCRFIKL